MKVIAVPHFACSPIITRPLRQIFDLEDANMQQQAIQLFQQYHNPDQDPDYWDQEPEFRDIREDPNYYFSGDFVVEADETYLFFTILD